MLRISRVVAVGLGLGALLTPSVSRSQSRPVRWRLTLDNGILGVKEYTPSVRGGLLPDLPIGVTCEQKPMYRRSLSTGDIIDFVDIRCSQGLGTAATLTLGCSSVMPQDNIGALRFEHGLGAVTGILSCSSR